MRSTSHKAGVAPATGATAGVDEASCLEAGRLTAGGHHDGSGPHRRGYRRHSAKAGRPVPQWLLAVALLSVALETALWAKPRASRVANASGAQAPGQAAAATAPKPGADSELLAVLDEAERRARALGKKDSDPASRVELLCAVAKARAAAGQPEQAKALLDAADESAAAERWPSTRIDCLYSIARARRELRDDAGQRRAVERLLEVAEGPCRPMDRARGYALAASERARVADDEGYAYALGGALTTLRRHPDGVQVTALTALLARASADAGQFDKALRVVEAVWGDHFARTAGLMETALAQGRAGEHEGALKTAGLIFRPDDRANALAEVARVEGEARRWEDARQTALAIAELGDDRARVASARALLWVGDRHAKAGDAAGARASYAEAARVLEGIDPGAMKARMNPASAAIDCATVAAAYAAAGDDDKYRPAIGAAEEALANVSSDGMRSRALGWVLAARARAGEAGEATKRAAGEKRAVDQARACLTIAEALSARSANGGAQ